MPVIVIHSIVHIYRCSIYRRDEILDSMLYNPFMVLYAMDSTSINNTIYILIDASVQWSRGISR
jgi:hypothetical protein